LLDVRAELVPTVDRPSAALVAVALAGLAVGLNPPDGLRAPLVLCARFDEPDATRFGGGAMGEEGVLRLPSGAKVGMPLFVDAMTGEVRGCWGMRETEGACGVSVGISGRAGLVRTMFSCPSDMAPAYVVNV
jgi:hypothetical protein